MEEDTNSNHHSSADIQKYLEGKLSALEMHAIEKAALEDPFLADAIEGMQNNLGEQGAKSFNKDVNELNERLQKRINEKDKLTAIAPNRVWQGIAAAVILLIGSTALIYMYAIKNSFEKKSTAIKKENAIADSDHIKNSISAASPKNDSSVLGDLATDQKKKEKSLSEPRVKQYSFKQKAIDKKGTSIQKNIAPSKQAELDKTENTDIAKDEEALSKTEITIKPDSLKNATAANIQLVQTLQGKAAGLSSLKQIQLYNNFVQGKVVDNYKNPVPGATVMQKNKKIATSTDANGFFKLSANNKDTITNVVVISVGFQSATLTLNNNDASANVIQLQPSNQSLNEVVVVGYSARKEDDNEDESFSPNNNKEKVVKAEPSVGWPSFNDYINQNKKITTGDSARKGKEIISFIVDTTNKLSSFKIKKSLSPAHDAEAIRLIKQGPSWKLLKRNKTKVTLAIEF